MKALLIVAIVVFGAILWWRGTGEKPVPSKLAGESEESVGASVVMEPKKEAPPEEEIRIREMSVLATNWRFEPEEIVVRKGERVKLVVRGEWSDHGFALPEFEIDRYIKEGDTVTVEFIADKVGEFPFSCNVYCGTGHEWMRGVLRVEE